MDTDKVNRRTERALASLMKWARRTPGAASALAVELTRRSGEQQFRQNVGKWIAEDPARRMQPRFGIGLMLMDIQTELKAGKWPRTK